jgi:crotonobetaine/carnitine-CoA ligase
MGNTNFREWFEDKVRLGGDYPCLWHKGDKLTYEQVNQRVDRVANAFQILGVKKGSKVALIMTNCPEFLYCWFALSKIGAITLFVNVGMKDEGLRHLLDSGDAEYVVINKDKWSHYEQVREYLPKIRSIICFPDREGIEGNPEPIGYEDLILSAPSVNPLACTIDEGDPLGFIHTAGTTGPPKWAVLSHKAYITSGESLREWSMTTYQDIFYDPLPYFHINPQTYFIMNALAGHASIVVVERYSASRLWQDICDYGATVLVLHIAPMVYALKRPVVQEETVHRLRLIPVAAWRQVMERFRIPVGLGGYGSTECPGYIAMTRFYLPIAEKWDFLGNTLNKFVGRPVDYVDIKIFDEHDREMPVGEIGEIVVRGKSPHVIFDGYYNMPDKNKEAFRNGWFHTGDAGWINEEGSLIFEGRRAESINVKGEWIPVEQVETTIRSHPDVVDAAIVGVPSETGQEVKACIQVFEERTVDPADLLDYCQARLARFMIPRYIEFVDEFSRTLGTDKIQKEILKKQGIENAWDRDKAGYRLKR